MLLFACNGTGVTPDTFSIINDEAVIHPIAIITRKFLPERTLSTVLQLIDENSYTFSMIFRVILFLLLATCAFADIRVQDGQVSADLQSQPLTTVLEQLKTQMNMKMMIDDGINGKTVSAQFENLPVGLALKKILEGTGINFVVLGGADGEPHSVFIGGSSPPGGPPRRLDNRPVGNRGVVNPANPQPPPPQSIPQPDMRQQRDGQRQPGARPQQLQPLSVPTGGGFVPDQPKNEQPPAEEEQPDEQIENESED